MANSNNNPQSVIPDVEYNVGGNFIPVPPPEGADAGKVLGAISEGTVGWVEDQGAGVVQQQSDWAESDDTKVTFIKHKPTVDQTYNASSTNAQSGTAVAGAIAGVNQVPSSTSSDEGKVLTVDSLGVPGWVTPAGGDGIKGIYPESVAASSEDRSLKVLNCNAFGLKYPAEGFRNSFRILTYSSFSTDSIPIYGVYHKMYTYGARYITLATKFFSGMGDGMYYAWFPCTGYITDILTPISKDIYLKSKTKTVFTSSNIGTNSYRADGTLYTGEEIKYRSSITTPFSETPSLELYAEDFDLIGDWSTVSTLPKLEWVLAFMKPNGTWTSVNGATVDNNSALAASIPPGLSIALQNDGGLELNPVTGLKVLNKLPSSTSTDEGKVLTVDSHGAAGWETPAIPTVDQTYNSSSTNAQSGTAVAEAVGSVAAVPSVTSTDDGKVLKASYDSVAGTGSFAWETQTNPTVDQTYDASSTNAQSGTAVAGALASVNQVPASTSSDANKVLTVDSQGVPGWATPAAPAGGDSDEWWGGDPGRITLPEQTLRLKFKDLTYDPRNETDTSFTDHFQSITKVEDGVYDFLFANNSIGYAVGAPRFYGSFMNKYLTDNEFIVVAFNFGTANYNKTKDMGSMFDKCTGLKAVYNVQDSTDYQNRNGSFRNMFYDCTGLVYFSIKDKDGNHDFRISTVSNFNNMFEGCTSLVDCNLVITRISGTADCSNMFNRCISLVTGPSVDNGVSNADGMFNNCKSLREFHLNYILGLFDIKADTVCHCKEMFNECQSLESSDIPFFLYHTVSDTSNMFKNCRKMTTPPRHIKVASSLNAGYMFSNCWALGSLPDMDYGAITTISNMFENCVMLPDISQLATVTWNASLTSVDNMFKQCWGIEKGLKDVYDNMAATATITSHSNTFKGCGTAFSNPDLAQIPSSWGGTGA